MEEESKLAKVLDPSMTTDLLIGTGKLERNQDASNMKRHSRKRRAREKRASHVTPHSQPDVGRGVKDVSSSATGTPPQAEKFEANQYRKPQVKGGRTSPQSGVETDFHRPEDKKGRTNPHRSEVQTTPQRYEAKRDATSCQPEAKRGTPLSEVSEESAAALGNSENNNKRLSDSGKDSSAIENPTTVAPTIIHKLTHISVNSSAPETAPTSTTTSAPATSLTSATTSASVIAPTPVTNSALATDRISAITPAPESTRATTSVPATATSIHSPTQISSSPPPKQSSAPESQVQHPKPPDWNIWTSASQKAADHLAQQKAKARLPLQSRAMKEFQKFQQQHARGIAAMRLEQSPCIPRDPVQMREHEIGNLHAKIKGLERASTLKKEGEDKASMNGWISASDAEKMDALEYAEPAIPQTGGLFGGRVMRNSGAVVFGGNQTAWSPAEWGGATDDSKGKGKGKEVCPQSGSAWPTRLEFGQEGNGRIGTVNYGRFLPLPRNDQVDPRLEYVTWNGVGSIPYQERQITDIPAMDRVAQAPKDEEEAYDRFEFGEEEMEEAKSRLGTELLEGIDGASEY